MCLGEVVCYNIFIDGKTNKPFVIFHTDYYKCRIDNKRSLNDIDKEELYKWVEQIQKINHVAGMFLAACYEEYKKIIAIDNDEEFDKQYDDFTDEYGDCAVEVKNIKN